jgi:hypothetical protein
VSLLTLLAVSAMSCAVRKRLMSWAPGQENRWRVPEDQHLDIKQRYNVLQHLTSCWASCGKVLQFFRIFTSSFECYRHTGHDWTIFFHDFTDIFRCSCATSTLLESFHQLGELLKGVQLYVGDLSCSQMVIRWSLDGRSCKVGHRFFHVFPCFSMFFHVFPCFVRIVFPQS